MPYLTPSRTYTFATNQLEPTAVTSWYQVSSVSGSAPWDIGCTRSQIWSRLPKDTVRHSSRNTSTSSGVWPRLYTRPGCHDLTIWPKSYSNRANLFLSSCFMNTSAGLLSVPTLHTRKCFAATRSCSHRNLVWIWRCLPIPRRAANARADELSLYNSIMHFKFQSSSKLLIPSPAAAPFVIA